MKLKTWAERAPLFGVDVNNILSRHVPPAATAPQREYTVPALANGFVEVEPIVLTREGLIVHARGRVRIPSSGYLGAGSTTDRVLVSAIPAEFRPSSLEPHWLYFGSSGTNLVRSLVRTTGAMELSRASSAVGLTDDIFIHSTWAVAS